MRILATMTLALLVCATTSAQQPSPLTEQHKHLAEDAGTWTGSMIANIPGVPEPVTLPIKEVNTLMNGGLWLVSEFESGPFRGHAQMGYDAKKKKYVGTWIDNQSTHLNVMEGEYDEDKKQMVMTFKGLDPMTGEYVDNKSVTTRPSKNKRKFVMYAKSGGEWKQSFEINYERAE